MGFSAQSSFNNRGRYWRPATCPTNLQQSAEKDARIQAAKDSRPGNCGKALKILFAKDARIQDVEDGVHGSWAQINTCELVSPDSL